MSSILKKPARDLSAEDYAAIEKPLGERVPYPGKGLGYIVGRNGEKKLTRYLSVLDKPLIITSERDLDEVEGMLMRNMPTPEMLKLSFEVMSAIHPSNDRRAMYLKGAPGAGKTFLFEQAGEVSSLKGAIKIDCTNMNLNELFWETVLDFNSDKTFYNALDAKIDKYNAAKNQEQRDGILNPLSIDILRDCLGHAFSEEAGKICIDWGGIKDGHRNKDGERMDTREVIEIAIAGLKKVSAKEGMDSIGGNALGMASQKGPAWQAYKEGRVLILDELNRAKRGTFGILHGWAQFLINEISECRIPNPLKEKGDTADAFLHFKRDEMGATHFVGMTGNTEDDSDEVLELPEALSSRIVPDPIASATLLGWQHVWCRTLLGIPISTIYHAQSNVWDKDPAEFKKKIKEWRELRETREIPEYQLKMLRRPMDILQATENLATFMDAVSKVMNPDSDWHKAGTLTQLLDDISDTFKKEVSVDFRKPNYFITKAKMPKPSVLPPKDESGPDIIPLISEMDHSDSSEDMMRKMGTHITYVILDWIFSNSFERGKEDLGNQLMQIAADCALVDPQLVEGMPSSRKTVAELLDETPFDSDDPDIRVELVRDLLCDYLRDSYPDITDDNNEIMHASVVRRSIEEISQDSSDLVIFNADPDSINQSPLQTAECVDMTPQFKSGDQEEKMRPEAEQLLSQYALLATLAAPELREHNLLCLWNEALSGSGKAFSSSESLVDVSLEMAENKSGTGVAATTIMVKSDQEEGSAKEIPLHIIWNKNMDRVLVVGEGEISDSLKRAFNDARVSYVDRTVKEASKTLSSSLSFVLGGEDKALCDTLRDAFCMRNKLPAPEGEEKNDSLSAMLLHKDLECFLPHYLTKRAA